MNRPLALSHRPPRRVIAVHLVLTLYGHWAVNDPRGSGSRFFIDLKFEPLGPIHFGRRPRHEQPTRDELKIFHAEHEQLLNFPLFWIDPLKREAIAEATREVLRAQGYTYTGARSAATTFTWSSGRISMMHRRSGITFQKWFVNACAFAFPMKSQRIIR